MQASYLGGLTLRSARSFIQPAMFDLELESTVAHLLGTNYFSPQPFAAIKFKDGGHNFRQENTFGFICLKLRFKMSVFVRYYVTLYLKFQKLIEKCVKQGLDNNEEIKLCIVNVKGMLMKLLLLPLKVKIDWRILPQC